MDRRTHGSGSHGGGGSFRGAQLASLVQRIVQQEIQRGIADPRLRGMVTVISVDISADCEEATLHVSVLPGEFGPLSVQALTHAAGHLRRAVLKQSRVRHAPRLRFVLDDSLKRAAAVEAAIREAAPGVEDPSTDDAAP